MNGIITNTISPAKARTIMERMTRPTIPEDEIIIVQSRVISITFWKGLGAGRGEHQVQKGKYVIDVWS